MKGYLKFVLRKKVKGISAKKFCLELKEKETFNSEARSRIVWVFSFSLSMYLKAVLPIILENFSFKVKLPIKSKIIFAAGKARTSFFTTSRDSDGSWKFNWFFEAFEIINAALFTADSGTLFKSIFSSLIISLALLLKGYFCANFKSSKLYIIRFLKGIK